MRDPFPWNESWRRVYLFWEPVVYVYLGKRWRIGAGKKTCQTKKIPKPSTQTLNPQPSTLNHQLSTLNPRP